MMSLRKKSVRLLKQILPSSWIFFGYHILGKDRRNAKISYAQEGEDCVLERFFSSVKIGTYVDIGAYHPFRFSNTYSFYLRGWRGINIDASQEAIDQFQIFRPHDMNVCALVGRDKQSVTYTQFTEGALSTCSDELAALYEETHGHKKKKIERRESISLSCLLDTHLSPGKEIDFMSIDVEGWEMNVLQSNDWKRYRPYIILVEALDIKSTDEIASTPVAQFLLSHGYHCIAKTFNTLFFKRAVESV